MSADKELELDHFQALLTERQRDLLDVAKTGDSAAEAVELDQSRVGRLSRMDALQGQAMSQEAQRRRERELANIKQALARIETGDYGYCQQCDEQIAAGRLEIDPSATLCIACAEKSR